MIFHGFLGVMVFWAFPTSATQIKSFSDEIFFICKSNIRSKKLPREFKKKIYFNFLQHFENGVFSWFFMVRVSWVFPFAAKQIKSFCDEIFFISKSIIRSKKLPSGFFLKIFFRTSTTLWKWCIFMVFHGLGVMSISVRRQANKKLLRWNLFYLQEQY